MSKSPCDPIEPTIYTKSCLDRIEQGPFIAGLKQQFQIFLVNKYRSLQKPGFGENKSRNSFSEMEEHMTENFFGNRYKLSSKSRFETPEQATNRTSASV
jgi:hypothetical protein